MFFVNSAFYEEILLLPWLPWLLLSAFCLASVGPHPISASAPFPAVLTLTPPLPGTIIDSSQLT